MWQDLKLDGRCRENLTNTARFSAILLAVPFSVGLIFSWDAGFGFLLSLIGMLFVPPAWLFALAIFSVSGFRSTNGLSPLWRFSLSLVAPAVLGMAALLVIPALWAGGFIGTYTVLAVNYQRYERIIADARNPKVKAEVLSRDGEIDVSIDVGPPLRVAFPQGGFLDNWSGIVFDPTGRVMEADGWDEATGEWRAPEDVTRLFGGDLVSCRRLWGDYYDCSFT